MGTYRKGGEMTLLDRLCHAWLGTLTRGLSPGALLLPLTDWLIHLALYPGKQQQLTDDAVQKFLELATYCACRIEKADEPPCVEPPPGDRRFAEPGWQEWPYDVMHQSFLLAQQWWHHATTDVRGMEVHHEQVMQFWVRQLLDTFSPSNFLLTNPELWQLTLQERGQNLLRGYCNWLDDLLRQLRAEERAGTGDRVLGRELAPTPGRVVFRNQLIELIQYCPTTDTVHPEPVLIVPAWIMKYYVLDLAPGRSLVEYLVSQGHTVFAISWKNPDESDRDITLDDYRKLGVMASLEVIEAILPRSRVHAVGYCLGGTLLAITAAAMARRNDERLASVTLFAAQIDFSEVGGLGLFIDESQVSYLEDEMLRKGYLDSRQMVGAFQLLHAQDLVWSRLVNHYLRGEREPMSDLMAWNADTTRMPHRMHSEYLRRLFLGNELSHGHYTVDGDMPVLPGDIRVPIFAVGTVTDHVAPWQSVYKINRLTHTEVSFLLTAGGHNAGIVSPPGHGTRSYRLHVRLPDDPYLTPEDFEQTVPLQPGSWWPAWQQWLCRYSGPPQAPPPIGASAAGYPVLGDAPGEYVLIR